MGAKGHVSQPHLYVLSVVLTQQASDCKQSTASLGWIQCTPLLPGPQLSSAFTPSSTSKLIVQPVPNTPSVEGKKHLSMPGEAKQMQRNMRPMLRMMAPENGRDGHFNRCVTLAWGAAGELQLAPGAVEGASVSF